MMTSVVDKYYRRIIQNIDNVKMKFDISSLLIKTKEHDSKISNNESDISSNLSKISNNESDISSNLSKISNNESDISSNLSKISNNETNISSNLSKISNNETNISSNLSKISNNETNISSNLSKISNNETNISSNLSKISNNETNISSNLSKISNNESDISSNLSKISNNESDISKIFELFKNKITQITFKKSFGIENKEFKFNRSTHFFEIFSTDIENEFIKDGELRISTKIYYKYKNLSNDITRLCHEYQLYSKDGIINTQVFNHQFYGEANYTTNILYVKEDFYIKLFDNYSKLKLILMLHRVNRKGIGNIDTQTYNNNSINVSFIENPIV